MAWSPDGHVVATASAGGAAGIWNADSGRYQSGAPSSGTWRTESECWRTKVTARDGGRLGAEARPALCTASADRTVIVSDDSGNALCTEHGFTDPVMAVCWSPDGRHLAAAGNDDAVQIYSVRPSRSYE